MLVALLLVTWANGAPLLARLVLGDRWTRSVDGGRLFLDGQPWLGASKTWRGWLACLLTTPILAVLLAVPLTVGLAVALTAMLGDSASSFIKRRLRLGASQSAPLLDQIPESLLPVLVLWGSLGLSALESLLVVGGFLLIDLALTPMASRIKGRHRHG